MVASIFMGLLTPCIGASRLSMLGLGLLVRGGVIGAASDGLPQLLAARFLEGVGILAVVVATPTRLNTVTAPTMAPRARRNP